MIAQYLTAKVAVNAKKSQRYFWLPLRFLCNPPRPKLRTFAVNIELRPQEIVLLKSKALIANYETPSAHLHPAPAYPRVSEHPVPVLLIIQLLLLESILLQRL